MKGGNKMHSEIMPLEEFHELTQSEMKEIYASWLTKYSEDEIQSVWGISNKKDFYEELARLNLNSSSNEDVTYDDSLEQAAINLIESDLDAVVPYVIFRKLKPELQRMTLGLWREKYSSKEIINYWGINANTMSRITKSLELPTLPRGRREHGTSPLRVNDSLLNLLGLNVSNGDSGIPVKENETQSKKRKGDKPDTSVQLKPAKKTSPSEYQLDLTSIQDLVRKTVKEALETYMIPHAEVAASSAPVEQNEIVPPKVLLDDSSNPGVSFLFGGEFNGKQAQEHLLSFAVLLQEDKKYNIRVQFVEKQ